MKKSSIFFISTILLLVIYLILNISLLVDSISDKEKAEVLTISPYNYPNPSEIPAGIEQIAILTTNDIHGHLLPDDGNPDSAGVLNFSPYINILRRQWGANLLWLDAGDQYMGTFESNTNGGEPIKDFFNIKRLDASSVGNHEFTFSLGTFKKLANEANFTYLPSNIKNKSTEDVIDYKGTSSRKIFHIGNIKIGVFGLTTNETGMTTGDITVKKELQFADYLNTTLTESQKLRDEGADLVIMVSHLGTNCLTGANVSDLLYNTMRDVSSKQGSTCNQQADLNLLLNKLQPGVLDAVVSGHTHMITHHWINDIPVISSGAYATYFSVLYLSVDKRTKKLIDEGVEMEGPVPICARISKSLNCTNVNEKKYKFTFHRHIVEKDKELYSALDKFIEGSQTQGQKIVANIVTPLNLSYNIETSLGNFMADSVKNVSGAEVVILQTTGIRVNVWNQGNLNYRTLFQTLPFNNMITLISLNGKDLKTVLTILQEGKRPLYSTAGVKQYLEMSPKKKVVNLTLANGDLIDESRNYTVATTQFLLNGGDDWFSVGNLVTPTVIRQVDSDLNIVNQNLENLGRVVDYVLDTKNPRIIFLNQKNRFLNLKKK